MLKIIQGEREQRAKKEDNINEKIVRFSNSQTAVNAADFRSNDLVQRSIERYASGYDYTVVSPIKKVFYKRKRRGESKPRTKYISMQDLGKAVYSYKYNPYDLNASISQLWDPGEKGKYYYVFGDDGEKTDFLPESYVMEMFAVLYIFDCIKNILKTVKKEVSPSVLFKYHVLWLVGKLLQRKYTDELDLSKIYRKIIQKGWYVNSKVDEKKAENFKKYIEKAYLFIDLMVTTEQKKEGFVMRNLQRSNDFCETLEDQAKRWITLDELPNLI